MGQSRFSEPRVTERCEQARGLGIETRAQAGSGRVHERPLTDVLGVGVDLIRQGDEREEAVASGCRTDTLDRASLGQ